jgi:hypothetical protein
MVDKFPPRVGEVILRPVDMVAVPGKGSLTYKKEPGTVPYGKSDNGDSMFWARRDPDLDNAWVATQDKKGLVCFLEDQEVVGNLNTTHFTIYRVGKGAKSVHVTPGEWDIQQLLDLFTTPNEERDAHDMLVNRVMDILKTKPDLLPLHTLVKQMNKTRLLKLLSLWIEAHKQEASIEQKRECVKVLRDALTSLDA